MLLLIKLLNFSFVKFESLLIISFISFLIFESSLFKDIFWVLTYLNSSFSSILLKWEFSLLILLLSSFNVISWLILISLFLLYLLSFKFILFDIIPLIISFVEALFKTFSLYNFCKSKQLSFLVSSLYSLLLVICFLISWLLFSLLTLSKEENIFWFILTIFISVLFFSFFEILLLLIDLFFSGLSIIYLLILFFASISFL